MTGFADWRPFIYGGVASIVAEFGTFPIDTAKTRLQIQGQKIDARHATLKYNGMTDVFVQISRNEGFRALYCGIGPAVLRQATYGTIKFGTYYSLKKILIDPSKESLWVNIFCAVVAGSVSSAIANPTDVLKVRLQVHGNEANHSLVKCFANIYEREGVGGLWRGVGPTSQRAAVIAAVELPVYDFCKFYLMPTLGNSLSNHFISSVTASLGSAVASTPLDVIRVSNFHPINDNYQLIALFGTIIRTDCHTRLMNQRKIKQTSPGQKVTIYKGTVDCFVKTVKYEGFFALYKGFIPTWFRMGPWNIIFFVTYEHLNKFY